jgi:glycosyltransferase involved in cell wall biosynthesis
MPTVLHLLDKHADFQTRTLARLIAGDGLAAVGRDWLAAARALRGQRQPQIIHAWGWRSLLAATIADLGPIIYTPLLPVSTNSIRWLKWISKKRDIQVICDSPQTRAAICGRGLPLDRCHIVPPGFELQLRDRATTRQKLGLTDDHFAVLAPGESNLQSGHTLALWAVAMAYESNNSWRLLLWGRGPLSTRLQRSAANMGITQMIRFAPDMQFEDLLSAADAATATALPSAGTLPLAMCMAAAIPLAGKPAEKPRQIALELLKLRNNDNWRTAQSQLSQNRASRSFKLTTYRLAHANLYASLPSHPSSLVSRLSPTHQDSSLPARAPQ